MAYRDYMGLRVQGLGFRVWRIGITWGLGYRVRGFGLGRGSFKREGGASKAFSRTTTTVVM